MILVSFVQFPAAAERVLKDSRCKELHLNLQFCYKCTIQQEIIFGYDEKKDYLWHQCGRGIMGSFHKHNRLNLGQCSEA